MFKDSLKNIGLSEKEMIIYISALESGPITVQQMAKETKIARTTIYNLLPILIDKGLILDCGSKEKLVITPRNPSGLVNRIQDQRRLLKDTEQEVKKILPTLQQKFLLSNSIGKLKVYEGTNGIVQIRKDMLSTKGVCCIEEFIPMDKVYKHFPAKKTKHQKTMLKQLNRTSRKLLYTTNSKQKSMSYSPQIESKYIASGSFSNNIEFNLYGNKAAIVVFQSKLLGLIIEDQGIVDSLRSVFYLLWNSADS